MWCRCPTEERKKLAVANVIAVRNLRRKAPRDLVWAVIPDVFGGTSPGSLRARSGSSPLHELSRGLYCGEMRRTGNGIAIVFTLLTLVVVACAPAPTVAPTPTPTAAPTPTPTVDTAPAEATVRAWLDAYAEVDADRLIALHIPEQRQIQRPGYESWAAEVQAALAQTEPDTFRSSFLRALWTDPGPVEVALEVLSESDREIVIDARGGTDSENAIPFRWKFRLSKPGDQWLIHGLSGFVPDGVLVWMEVVVSDDQGNPVPGAQVTIDDAGQPVTRLTDDSGLAVFPDIPSPVELDAITVAGSSIASKESRSGFYSVELRPNLGVNMFMVRSSQGFHSGGLGGVTIGPVSTGDVEIQVFVHWQNDLVPQTFDIVLSVGGEPRDSASVQITGGDGSVQVPFTLFFDEPGTYKLGAGGKSVMLSVAGVPFPTPTPTPTPTLASVATPDTPAAMPRRVVPTPTSGLKRGAPTPTPAPTPEPVAVPDPTPAGAPSPAALPHPVLAASSVDSIEVSGNPWVVYTFTIVNWEDYPSELFARSPELPPCGLNTEASRAWVYIRDAETGGVLESSCTTYDPRGLTTIVFALPEDKSPPEEIYVELVDRQTGTVLRSNTVVVAD